VLKNVYAFLNFGMAGLVMATVAVRFLFPAVSSEGAAFWVIRTSPVRMHDFLWSKFWAGVLPVVLLTETLTILSNEFLGVEPFLKWVSAGAMVFMSFAIVGLAVGLGARYPRFAADNASQVAGSYGGISFMVAAVLFVMVTIALLGWPSANYLWYRSRGAEPPAFISALMAICFAGVAVLSVAVWLGSMRAGITALVQMDRTPS
jgi:ABC-2 type transport system permease protein